MLQKEIIDIKELYDKKTQDIYTKMSSYKEKVNKMMIFHNRIIGCLDKIDEIRMEKLIENI